MIPEKVSPKVSPRLQYNISGYYFHWQLFLIKIPLKKQRKETDLASFKNNLG